MRIIYKVAFVVFLTKAWFLCTKHYKIAYYNRKIYQNDTKCG